MLLLLRYFYDVMQLMLCYDVMQLMLCYDVMQLMQKGFVTFDEIVLPLFEVSLFVFMKTL